MNSSSDPRAAGPEQRVLAAEDAPVAAMPTPELRHGTWTRHGGTAVLGDRVTESLLGRLAEEARAAATAQGYATGWAEGRREAATRAEEESAVRRTAAAEAERRREDEHRAALAALTDAAAQVRATLSDLAAAVEEQGTDLAWAVLTELLGHQLSVEGGSAVIQRVLRVLPTGPIATVRLHPSVAATTAADDLSTRGVQVRADATLGPADALVEYDGGVVDLRIDSARDRIREALGVSPQAHGDVAATARPEGGV